MLGKLGKRATEEKVKKTLHASRKNPSRKANKPFSVAIRSPTQIKLKVINPWRKLKKPLAQDGKTLDGDVTQAKKTLDKSQKNTSVCKDVAVVCDPESTAEAERAVAEAPRRMP